MADFTKAAIRHAFIQLLNEKPLKQITVRDIVDRCGINRNTFYYHFQDIPALLEDIIKEDAEQIIQENPKFSSIEEVLNTIIGFSLEHRRAVMHIYKSINRDIFELHQWRICRYAVSVFLDGRLEHESISEEDRKIISSYIESLCFGVLMGWLESGLQDNIQAYIHRLCQLKQGDLDRVIEKCKQ